MMRLLLAGFLSTGMALGPAPAQRAVEGPTSVEWTGADDVPETTPETTKGSEDEGERGAEGQRPPPPSAARPGNRTLRVAVGLDPSAPGTKAERSLLATLSGTVKASEAIGVDARRLRIGAPSAREVCRDGRDDLVVMIGYVPQREEAVLLPYDCVLDVPLAVRSSGAADEAVLVATLWDEHDALVRDGVQERRRRGRLGPKARAGIVAGVVVLVVGAAVGLLVANALRDETVVLKVGP
ncbi:MAG: hypothetical protein ACE37F_28310 [Nannocystaceae bacterium]|nr:hypothetical protein [bacterium]